MPSEHRTEIRAKRILKRLLVLLSILASLAASAQAVRTEIIEFGYISAAEIIPVLKPLVPAPGSVSGIYTTLVVKSTPDNLEDILAVIQNLDRAPRNLLIILRHGISDRSHRSSQKVGVSIHSGSSGTEVSSSP